MDLIQWGERITYPQALEASGAAMLTRLFGRLFAASETSPGTRSQASWLTSIGGFRGPQAITMDIYRLGDQLPSGPGVFLFAAHNSRRWNAVFVGETSDLRSRVPGHETLPEALLLGVTHVHIAKLTDPIARRSAAERLVFMYGPAMNAAGAPTLRELIASGQRPEPAAPETPRLAVAG